MRKSLLIRAALTAAMLTILHLPATAQLFLEEIVVFAVDTVPKQSQVLQAGKSYDIICSGTFTFWDNAAGDSVGLVDAAFYLVIPPGEFGIPGVSTTIYNGFLLNGQPISSLIVPSGVSPTNTYRVPFIGRGAPVEVFIEDHPLFSVDRHSDNHGAIRVRIYNVSPEIVIDSSAIDFGEVELGDRRDTVVQFRNEGYGPLRVNDIRLVGPDAGEFALQAQGTYVLEPGDSASFTVSFIPTAVFRKQAAVQLSCNDSDSPVVNIPLFGTGVTTLEAGCRNDLRVSSQQLDLIPVTLFTNRDGSMVTRFAFELSYDPRLLRPDGIETRGTLSESFAVDWTLVRPGLLSVTGSGSAPLSGTGTLLHLRVFAVWSDPPVSPLTLDGLLFNAGNPRAVEVDGAVEVDSLCNQYLRSVRAVGAPLLRANTPNPFNPRTSIHVDIPDRQHIRLEVFDAAGRHVRRLADGLMDAGAHVFTFDAAVLSSGMYFARLRSVHGVQTRTMLLIR